MDTKLFLIARVSDKMQVQALPAQKRNLVKYAESLDMPYTYAEFNESAYKAGPRAKFLALIHKIERQSQTTLCIVAFDKVDRFSRDATQDEVKIMTGLVRAGKIEMHFPSDNIFISQSSPAGDLFRLNIDLVLGKYNSDTTRDNVNRRFAQMLDNGEWVSAPPIGYIRKNYGTIKRPKKTIEIDPERGHHIVKIFELRSTGMTYLQIAKVMNEAGLRTTAGNKVKKQTIENICNRHWYYGRMNHKGTLMKHGYPPLVSYRLFMKCQQIREQRYRNRTAYGEAQYMLRGLILCGKCGCSMCPYMAKNRVYLRCSGAKGKCGNKNVSQALILPEIRNLLASIAIPEDSLPLIIEELRKRHDNQSLYQEKNLAAARKELGVTTDRLKRLTYKMLDDQLPTDLYEQMLNDLTNRQQELHEQIETLTSSNNDFLITESYLLSLSHRLVELFDSSNEELRHKLLKTILSNLVLTDKVLTYEVNDPYKTFIDMKKSLQTGSKSSKWCG